MRPFYFYLPNLPYIIHYRDESVVISEIGCYNCCLGWPTQSKTAMDLYVSGAKEENSIVPVEESVDSM